MAKKKIEFNMEAIKKYLFWACTPIGLVVAVLAGIMAIGSIAKELNDQKQTLDSQKQSMGQLRGAATTHPNQGTIDAIKEAQEALATNVFTAWETLVQDQQARNLWTGLGDFAQNEIRSKDFLDDLSSTTRMSYLQFARGEMDKLGGMQKRRNELNNSDVWRVQEYLQNGQPVTLLRLTENVTNASGFGGGGGGGATSQGRRENVASTVAVGVPTTQSGKVVWDTPALDVTMKNWEQEPQSFEVWLTQEDLWVYQALLWVIAESNKDVREASKTVLPGASTAGGGSGTISGAGGDPLNLRDAVVKEIVQLSIGKNAARPLDQQSRRSIRSGVSSGMDGLDSSSGDSSSGSQLGGLLGASDSGSGGSDGVMMTGLSPAAMAEAMRRVAMAGRYVDAEGKPLMEPDLTAQFRRMPVLLELRVDQRYISDILVNCANSPMPIDVLWVTVSPENTQQMNYAPTVATVPGMSGSGSAGGQGAGRRPPSGGGGSAGRTRGTGNVDFGPHEVVIEILGCINIFAPPEREKIGGGI